MTSRCLRVICYSAIAAGLLGHSLGCAGTRRISLDPAHLPVQTLGEVKARVEVSTISGSIMRGDFGGASDSALWLGSLSTPVEVSLDSVAYVTYLHPMRHTERSRRKGLLRGIGIGLLDAALLTLIYSSADNSVNKGTLFWATALTTAIPLSIYFTLEAGHKGQALDEQEIGDISARMARELQGK